MKKNRQFKANETRSVEEEAQLLAKVAGITIEEARREVQEVREAIDHRRTLPMATKEQHERFFDKCRWW